MKKSLLTVLLITSLVLVGCTTNSTNSTGSNIPSGNDCAENVAYLQSGVDKYKEAFGDYPSNVQLLLQAKNGKGPFVEVLPECPTGNQYVIENGAVKEAPKQ